jgi:hypothetical protein
MIAAADQLALFGPHASERAGILCRIIDAKRPEIKNASIVAALTDANHALSIYPDAVDPDAAPQR